MKSLPRAYQSVLALPDIEKEGLYLPFRNWTPVSAINKGSAMTLVFVGWFILLRLPSLRPCQSVCPSFGNNLFTLTSSSSTKPRHSLRDRLTVPVSSELLSYGIGKSRRQEKLKFGWDSFLYPFAPSYSNSKLSCNSSSGGPLDCSYGH